MTDADLLQAIARSRIIVESLQRSLAWLDPRVPLDAASVTAFTEHDRDRSDALLKRLENLVNVLQDQVFRLIANREIVRDPGGMSRRDVLDYMEKIGAVASAYMILDAVLLRDRLSRVYPDDPVMQAGQLNRVHAAARTAIAAVGSVELWAARLTPPASP